MLQPGEGTTGQEDSDRTDTVASTPGQGEFDQSLIGSRREGKSDESNANGGSSETEYLVALDYQSDAERKRVEYLLNNRDDITVNKIRGLARIVKVDEDNLEAFYEDLSAKVDGIDHLRVNELSDVDVVPDENHERISIETDSPADQVEWAFETIKRKRDATVEDSGAGTDTTYKQYVATTQSGTVRYSYEVSAGPSGDTHVDVHVWGYGDAPEVLRSFIEEELSYAI